MRTATRIRGLEPGTDRGLAAFLIGLVVVGNVVQAARIYDLFWEDASRFGFLAQGIPVAIYMMVAAVKRHWTSVIAALAVAALILYSHAHFVEISGTEQNYNTVANLIPLLIFLPFLETSYPVDRIIRLLLGCAIVYLLTYVVLLPIISRYYTVAVSVLLPSHDGEGERLFLGTAYAAFVMMHGLRAKTAPIAWRAFLILLGGTALWLADSRLIILIVAAVFALGSFDLLIRPVRAAIFAVVAFFILMLLLGFVFSDWNPYFIFNNDGSGAYRALEYNWTVRILEHHWISGVGTPGKFVDLQLYLQREFAVPRNIWIFSSDLGMLGVLFQFGILGLIGFIGVLAYCMLSNWNNASIEMQGLQMTTFACCFYAINSPLLLLEPSAIFPLLMIAASWRAHRSASAERVLLNRFRRNGRSNP